jgi:ABC-2 type transport system permease protein
MRLDNVLVILKREYLQRVKTKGFWIGTLTLPLFIGALTVLPGLLISKSQSSQSIVVVDETGRIAKPFAERANARDGSVPKGGEKKGAMRDESQMARFEVKVEPPAADRKAQRADLNRRVLDKTVDAWVWIGPGVLKDKPVEYHARSVSNVFTQDALEDDLSWVVRRERMQQAGIDPDRVAELTRGVRLDTQRVSESGSHAAGGMVGMFFALSLFLILYMSTLLWGQQVLNGVLEEKGSRVIEVLISAVTSFELMMGKLAGICLVGLTQLGIWFGTMAVLTAPGVVAALAFMPNVPTLSAVVMTHFLLLFILGFFAFATLYAAIGASFNNLQEAQQAASTVAIFIVIPAMVMWPVINDPNSTMATVLSLIPIFTPLLMPLRIATEMPPAWQLVLAYVLTIGFVVGMVWFCSKIYRVGILMYGKKPTFKEIWKWTRYA